MSKTTYKRMRGWAVLDSKGKLRKWIEGRFAVYSSTHGGDISRMRERNYPHEFQTTPCTITYTLPKKVKGKKK